MERRHPLGLLRSTEVKPHPHNLARFGACEGIHWHLNSDLRPLVAQFEQYEVWVLPEGESSRWEMVAAFPDFDVASTVAMNRKSRVRLLHCVYEDQKLVEQQVLADLGDVKHAS